MVYYAFDLLWRDGDLRKLPQIECEQALLELLDESDAPPPVQISEHLIGDGQQMFEHAAKLNREGIISKRADAPYRSDRNENWLKIKAVHTGKLVVGFVKDPSGVALYLSKEEGKLLVYMGKVGDRLVSYYVKPDQETIGCGGQPEVQTDAAHQKAESNVRRYRIPRHHVRGLAAGEFIQRADQRNRTQLKAFVFYE